VSAAPRIVVVGTSAGGLGALREFLHGLPADWPTPVIVVQHRHRDSDTLLVQLLQAVSPVPVCDVEDKAPLCGGQVYVAPADYHLLVDDGRFVLSVDEPVRYSRPSIDLTFSSVADEFGATAVGIVLTGANADGSRGLRRIVERGGVAIVQEPETAESPTMPAAAVAAVPDAHVLPIPRMGELLRSLLAAPGAPVGA
jgi:two-component system chemotaxis response regulator CheB